MTSSRLTSLEICAGAGGQALGLEGAGFDPVMLIESDENSCKTLRWNRRSWDVRQDDVVDFDPAEHQQTYDVDLLSGGMPRVKSTATITRLDTGKEWELLRAAVWLAHAVQPRAVLLENVPDLVEKPEFSEVRAWMEENLADQGYITSWRILDAVDFGVPQHRRQGFLLAMREENLARFQWPQPTGERVPTVGEVLCKSMASEGWPGAEAWAAKACEPAPAIVGGSVNRGGADLGPRGQKRAWARLGVNGNSIADGVPGPETPADERPRLNVRQVAELQAFPENWTFVGKKTSIYRQIGHASPPPVAEAVGRRIVGALGCDE